ncbi:hypothetical protein QHF89_32930 [Polyangium sorediatum]|uniref:Tetratricopeptide repeat protein n=1 Tax=Polyangium sorediatum TaxID=889274 RepID=A0ABT6P169_9BACT|nr:hypothetical protein [Polyangium sorediatum]
MRVGSAAALGLVLVLGSSVARANDPAAADALFQAAKKLMSEKNFAEACPKFDASYKLDPTLGTLLNLADCYEKFGRTATAWSTWGEAMEKALRDGDKRADFARSRRDALFPKLPKVVINVQNEVPGVDILWDQVKLAPAVFGVELPADPAEHDLLVLRDDGMKLKEERVRITQEGARTELTLDIEALDKANPRKVKVVEAPPPPPPGSSKQRVAGLVVGGFGAAALIAAGALEGVALAKRGAASDRSACVNKFCTPDGLAAISSAQTFAEAGQWIGLGGIVAAAVGITLLITAPPAAPSPRPATGVVVPRPMWVAPWAGPNGGGLVVGGAL